MIRLLDGKVEPAFKADDNDAGAEASRGQDIVMPSFEEARRLILDSVTALAGERVNLLESLGRVTAEEIVAPWNLPACDNAAMDGYAVRSADCEQPASLRITGFVPAGAMASAPVDSRLRDQDHDRSAYSSGVRHRGAL